jgi:hypothetical protein
MPGLGQYVGDAPAKILKWSVLGELFLSANGCEVLHTPDRPLHDIVTGVDVTSLPLSVALMLLFGW